MESSQTKKAILMMTFRLSNYLYFVDDLDLILGRELVPREGLEPPRLRTRS